LALALKIGSNNGALGGSVEVFTAEGVPQAEGAVGNPDSHRDVGNGAVELFFISVGFGKDEAKLAV